MKIYKDGVLWYECISQEELLAIQQTIANNLQNNYYTNVETMNLIASSRAVYQVATMPSEPTINTIYYVGSTSPYNVKLVDSNGTVVDLGSSEVDLTGYLKASDIDTNITENSTNNKVASSLSVFRYSAQAPQGLISLTGCLTLADVFKRITQLVTESTTTFRNYFVSSWITAFPSALKVPDLDDYGVLQFCGCYRNNSGTENILGELRFRPSGSSIWYRTPISSVNWKPIQGDAFAPLDSAFVSGGNVNFLNPDNAIFNFDTTQTGLRQSGRKDFMVLFTDPIGNADYYAICTTEIIVNNYGSNGATTIWQTARGFSSSYKGAVLKRSGNISGIVNATAITSATISWQPWYPIDYQQTSLTLNTGYTGTIFFKVVGGNLTLVVRGFKTGGSGFVADFPADLTVPHTYQEGVLVSNTGKTAMLNITKYQNVQRVAVYGVETDVSYNGSMTVPLGY